MKDENKSKAQLIKELVELRQRVAEPEMLETEHQQVEEQLRLRAQLLDSLRESVVAADLGGRVVYWSKGAELLYGYSADEVLGRSITFIVKPEERHEEEERLRQVRETGLWTGQYVQQRKDGSWFWADTVISLVTDQYGQPRGFIGIDRDITQRKQAEERLARHAREMAALHEISLEINTQLDVSTLLQSIVRRAAELLGTRMGGLFLVKPDGETLELVAGHNQPDKYLGTTLRAGEGLSGHVVQTGQPMMLSDYSQWEGRTAILSGSHVRRILGVPLKQGSRVIGVLNVFDEKTDAFDDDQIQLLNLFAAQAATAIQNVRLFEAERRQAEQLEALHRVSQDLTMLHDLDTLLHQIVERAIQLLDGDGGGIYLYRPERQVLEWTVVVGENMPAAGLVFSKGEGLAGKVWVSGEPLSVDDYQNWPGKSPQWSIFSGAAVGVPIQWGEEFLGTLNVSVDSTRRRFTSDDAALLSRFATKAAIAINNARRLAAEREQRLLTETLVEVTLALTSQISDTAVLREILNQVQRIVPYKTANIALLQDDTLHIACWQGYEALGSEELISELTQPLTDFPLETEAVRSQKPIVIYDTHHDPRWVMLDGTGWIRSYLVVPICLRDRVLGLLRLDGEAVGEFSPEDADRLLPLANAAAIALENAQLFEKTATALTQTEALYRASRSLIALESLSDVLQAVVDGVAEALPANRVLLYTLDLEKRQVIHFVKGGPGSGQMRPASFDELWAGLSGWVLRELEPALSPKGIPDSRESPVVQQRRIETDGGSIIVVPLRYRNKTMGTMTAVNRTDERDFTPQDAELMMAMANQAAIAIENAQSYAKTQRRLKEQTALREAGIIISSTLDLTTVLNHIAEQMSRTLDATSAYICSFNPETMTSTVLAEYMGPQASPREQVSDLGATYPENNAKFFKTLLAGQVDISHIDDPNLSAVERAHLQQYGAKTVLCAPLQIRGQLIGFAELWESRQKRDFSFEEIALCQAIAQQAAIAMENARLHQETQKQARQVQQILDTIQDGILLLDPEHRVRLANPAAQTYLNELAEASVGQTLHRLGGQPLAEMLASTGDDRPPRVISTGSPRREFEVSARPLEAGPVAEGWVMVIRNVTEERKIQDRVRLQERLAAVGQLAAGIAHDFNNILTSIIGYAELVRNDAGISEPARQDLERIVQQGQRAARLVRQILDFSRQSLTERQPMDLAPFIKETVKLLERTIPEDIRITLELEPGEYLLRADSVQIQQALTNLAVNARDAMPKGGLLEFRLSHLTLTPGEHPPCPQLRPGDWIVLSISDTGVGISPELRSHLFEPFFTTKGVGQGTGLGLAQVYGIVKQHGGEIDVESWVGKGTTFLIYLPTLSTLQKKQAESVPITPPRGQDELILLVEDDPTVLKVAKTMLEHLGYQVQTAVNGRQALEVYDQHRGEIALVLTDVTMPEMGGIELSQALRERDSGVKIVALTGYPLETEAKETLEQGIVGWLQKPLDLNKLAQIIRQSLQ